MRQREEFQEVLLAVSRSLRVAHPPNLRPALEPVPLSSPNGRDSTTTLTIILARGPARHDPLRADQGGRSGRRAGEPDRAGAAVRLPLPGQPHAPGRPGSETALSRGAACPDPS